MERKDLADGKSCPRYILFSVGNADVLVSVIKGADEQLPSVDDVYRMREAAEVLERRSRNNSPSTVVSAALRGAGYGEWSIVHIGEINHVEL